MRARFHLLCGAGASIAMLSTAASAKVVPRQSDPGVDLANMGSSEQTFYFCDNASNGDGTADPGFTDGTSGCSNLVTSVAVQPSAVRSVPACPTPFPPEAPLSSGKISRQRCLEACWNPPPPSSRATDTKTKKQTTSVSLDATFKGRIARSTDTPATWVEVQIQATDGQAWGDVSLEIGCDGAAEVGPTDGGSSSVVGFSSPGDIVASAPAGATETRAGDGATVISAPWSMGAVVNQAAADYLEGAVPGGNQAAYITGTSGTEVTTSSNNRLAVTFY